MLTRVEQEFMASDGSEAGALHWAKARVQWVYEIKTSGRHCIEFNDCIGVRIVVGGKVSKTLVRVETQPDRAEEVL